MHSTIHPIGDTMDLGHLDMRRLGELLIEAAKQPQSRDGMVISAPGALTIAARALNDLAAPLESTGGVDDLLEKHQGRLDEVQPRMAAHSLELFAKHLGMLRAAVAEGNVSMVGRFFNLYVFD